MIILHIADINGNLTAGVNNVVPQHIIEQQKHCDAALLNISNCSLNNIENQFFFGQYEKIENLPDNFSKPDLVIFHEVYRPVYLKIYKQLLKDKIPYIIIPHGCLTSYAQKKKWLKKKVANILLFNDFIRHAQAIQCLSDRELNLSGVKHEKFIGTNGISVKPFIKKEHLEDKIVLTFIGRMEVYIKGLDLLIEAVSLLEDKESIELNLYGPDEGGYHKEMKNMISKYGLNEIVIVKDAVFGKEKESVLRKTDIYIQVSRSEGMSASILEALSYGLPCVLSVGTGMKNLIEKYNAGWICENTAESIADTINQAVKEKISFSHKSEQAYKMIADNFDWNIVTSDNLNRYKDIISRYKNN